MIDEILARLGRMLRFDHTVYPEIANDGEATAQAIVVVLVTALLSGLGAGISGRSIGAFLFTILLRVPLGWLLWSGLVYLIGTRLFAGQATFWHVARVLGYASAPLALGVLSAFTCLGPLFGLAGALLALLLGFFATRETLGLATEKALLTILISWVLSLLLGVLVPVPWRW